MYFFKETQTPIFSIYKYTFLFSLKNSQLWKKCTGADFVLQADFPSLNLIIDSQHSPPLCFTHGTDAFYVL